MSADVELVNKNSYKYYLQDLSSAKPWHGNGRGGGARLHGSVDQQRRELAVDDYARRDHQPVEGGCDEAQEQQEKLHRCRVPVLWTPKSN